MGLWFLISLLEGFFARMGTSNRVQVLGSIKYRIKALGLRVENFRALSRSQTVGIPGSDFMKFVSLFNNLQLYAKRWMKPLYRNCTDTLVTLNTKAEISNPEHLNPNS